MNKTTLVCFLIAVLLVSCQASFNHHRQYAGRQYIKAEPGIMVPKTNSVTGTTTPVATSETGVQAPVQYPVKDEKKSSISSSQVRKYAPVKKPSLLQTGVKKKYKTQKTEKTVAGGALNTISLIFGILGWACVFIGVILTLVLLYGSGIAPLVLFFMSVGFAIIAVICGSIGLGTKAAFRKRGVAGVILGSIILGIFLIVMTIYLILAFKR